MHPEVGTKNGISGIKLRQRNFLIVNAAGLEWKPSNGLGEKK